jgi:hypothetical protein
MRSLGIGAENVWAQVIVELGVAGLVVWTVRGGPLRFLLANGRRSEEHVLVPVGLWCVLVRAFFVDAYGFYGLISRQDYAINAFLGCFWAFWLKGLCIASQGVVALPD